MQRIAGMTVKADGACEAWYNGQRDKMLEAVKAEMQRQKEAMNAEMDSMRDELADEIAIERDRADINARARFRLLGDRLEAFTASLTHKRGPVKRALRVIENAWAMAYGITKCLPEIGERLGLWEIIREEEHYENHKRAACADGRQRRAQQTANHRVEDFAIRKTPA